MNDLTAYMNKAIERILKQAVRFSPDNPAESAFLVGFALKQKAAGKRRAKSEIQVPSFLIASVASQCNLHCKGCYARANGACGSHHTAGDLSSEQWDGIFEQAEEMGIPFILLAGGEPLTRADVLKAAARHKGILFPVFTNGTMFDPEYQKLFDKSRNLLPIFSLEGDASQTDERRGSGVYSLLSDTMDRMNEQGIYYGASVTVTHENLLKVTDPSFVSELHQKGCKLIIWVEYVPAQPGTENLALSEQERELLAGRHSRIKEQFDELIFLSFPGDEEELGGCLAAGRGFFHINSSGAAEPCPFSPFSDISLKDHTLRQALESPLFVKLREGGFLQGEHSGGCVLFQKEREVKDLCGCAD